MHPALLYLPGGRLALAELCAARLDGHLVDLGDGFIPADLVEVPATRAASLASLIPRGTAASGRTAAWIHGAGDAPPARHHVSRAIGSRFRPAPSTRLVMHDVFVDASDQMLLGGVLTTTPVRTMVDLAVALHRDPGVRAWMTALAAVDPELVPAAVAAIDALHRVPGKVSGRAALLRIRTT
ncbi:MULTISPECIES: hypothetical protein [unclassified Microbacterium]|uniref:hypothetical protein n=1 Tax=unclassified Microbacterium TaxID=2609290 RepID=UPI0034192AFD